MRSPLRDVALASLLGKNYSEVRVRVSLLAMRLPSKHAHTQAVFVRDPVDRALSGYYFITMSRRRTDAVNAARASLHCGAMRLD